VLDQALFERAEQALALLPDGRAVDGAARGLEREDADLQGGEGELLSVALWIRIAASSESVREDHPPVRRLQTIASKHLQQKLQTCIHPGARP
jgi:hypothetical protein